MSAATERERRLGGSIRRGRSRVDTGLFMQRVSEADARLDWSSSGTVHVLLLGPQFQLEVAEPTID